MNTGVTFSFERVPVARPIEATTLGQTRRLGESGDGLGLIVAIVLILLNSGVLGGGGSELL